MTRFAPSYLTDVNSGFEVGFQKEIEVFLRAMDEWLGNIRSNIVN